MEEQKEKSEIVEMIENREYSQVRKHLACLEYADIALILNDIEQADVLAKTFRLLKKDDAAEVFAYMDKDSQLRLMTLFTDKEIAGIVNEMATDDTVDFLEEMPANVVIRVLKLADKTSREQINKMLKYADKTAGSLMTTEYVSFIEDLTIEQCFSILKKVAGDMETISNMFVKTKANVFLGIVTIKDMIMADRSQNIKDIMGLETIYARTFDDQEEVSKVFSKYDVSSMPVLDSENRLVGIITIDDIVDVIQQENTDDFQKMSAITSIEDSYLKTSVFTHFKSRIVWLVVLMFSSMLSGILLSSYEDAFLVMPILVSFIPMLMNTGGNCGNQTNTLMIRGLALGDISSKDFWRVFFKEIQVSLLCGLCLSVLNTIRIWIQYGNLLLGCAVSASMFVIVLIANFLGFALPILVKKLKLDPALMAAPIITTIVDIVATFTFFNIAKLILGL